MRGGHDGDAGNADLAGTDEAVGGDLPRYCQNGTAISAESSRISIGIECRAEGPYRQISLSGGRRQTEAIMRFGMRAILWIAAHR